MDKIQNTTEQQDAEIYKEIKNTITDAMKNGHGITLMVFEELESGESIAMNNIIHNANPRHIAMGIRAMTKKHPDILKCMVAEAIAPALKQEKEDKENDAA